MRAAADTIVWVAFWRRFLSSKVSIKSLVGESQKVRKSAQRRHISAGVDIRVPLQAAVGDLHIFEAPVDISDLLDTLVKGLLGSVVGGDSVVIQRRYTFLHEPEDSSIRLHGLLHLETDLGSGLASISGPEGKKESTWFVIEVSCTLSTYLIFSKKSMLSLPALSSIFL